MHQYTRYLLAGLAVSAMTINPCNAQTLVENSNNNSDNNAVTESISNVDANQPSLPNSSDNKSVVPSDAVSQASGVSKPINPRIPIVSRVFGSMEQ